MALDAKDREEARLYLLGRLKPERRLELLEERIMTEQDYYEELLAIEDEVIDQYLANELSRDEREAFEQYFLRTPERASKLRFARAFNKYVAAAQEVSASPAPARQSLTDIFRRLFAAPVRVAAVALVLISCMALVWWLFLRSDSEVNKGLIALREAYGNRRPLEARITDFEYAPWSVTRGGNSQPEVNATSLDRAERILLDAVHERPNAATWHALGQLYLAERKYDQAITQFEEALKTDKDNARLHNDFGVALFEKARMERASDGSEKNIESLAQSVEQFNLAVELNDSLTEAHFNRALAYQEMMLRQQAEEGWREYLRKDSTSPWADEARRHLKLLEESKNTTSQKTGNLLKEFLDARRAGDDSAAWKLVSQNYTSAGNEVTNQLLDSQLGLSPAESSIEHDVSRQALAYLAQLELGKTGNRYTSDLVKHYERATPEMRLRLRDARSHMKAGYALFTKSMFAEAVGEYSKAKLDYERADDSAERVFAEYRLAHCYVFLPDLKKARAAFEHLFAVAETNEYRWLLAHSLYGLAHVSADSSEYSKAVDYSSRALSAFESADDRNGVLRCLVQLADVHRDLNRIGRALGYLQRGLALTGDMRAEPMQRWGILVEIAFSLSSKRLDTAALFYQKEALGLALEMGRPLVTSRSYGYVGSAYASMKSYDQAMSYATRAFEIGEGMPEGTGGSEIMANATLQFGNILRLEGECGKAVQAYDKSIRLYQEMKVEYYSYAAHKGKLLCFMNSADDRATGEELQTVLALFEQYRAKITAESHRNSFFDMEQSVYDLAMRYEFTRMKNPVKAFEYSEVSRARSLLDELRRGAEVLEKNDGPDINLSGVTSPLSLADIQKGIPDNTQILQYAVLDDRLLLWAVTNSSVQYKEVPIGAQQLTEKVRALLAAASVPPSANNTDYYSRAEDLYQVLIAPAEPFLDKAKFLCIVPDKILHYLPYSALRSPATDRYLMEDYDFGLAPSSSTFVSVSASASKKAGAIEERLLSVGDPDFRRASFPSLPELPSAAREAKAVSGFYNTSRVLVRDAAREQSVKSEIEKANVAHLALHYLVDESSEMLSGFPLAPELAHGGGRNQLDGFLQSYEIYRMKLPRTRLVVLSACQTGIEQQYAGEGVIGVARPFLVAGVPVVVASLWPVDTDASAELMVNFHRHRTRDALTVTQSLRRAQIEMARGEDVHYRHPYYWATFIAVGGHSRF
jgi:CHAT domain-containing protein